MEHPFQEALSYWFKRIYRDFNSLYDQKLAAYGLTTSQVNVLELLWTIGDGQTQKDLHENLNIRPASLTSLLDALSSGNWIVRRSDPEDARVKRIFLTDAGKAQSLVCMKMIGELEHEIRQGMSQEEVSLMLVWMKKIHSNIPSGE